VSRENTGELALDGNTCLKGAYIRMPMQLHSSGTITCRLPCFRLQKQRAGGPHVPVFRIVLRIPPCEGPRLGRLNRRPVAQPPRRVGEGGNRTVAAHSWGSARQHCPCSRLPAHEDLRETISWTTAIRCPIQRMTGTAIELPRAR